MVTVPGRMLLAGGSFGKVEDVIEATTRFFADPRIVGRAMVAGAKVKVQQNTDEGWMLVDGSEAGEQKAIWDIHDFEESDLLMRNMIRITNHFTSIRG